MAWQQTDVDDLKAAIATGAKEVAYSDGRKVVYRSLAEMRQTLAIMDAEVAGASVETLKSNRVVMGFKSDAARGFPVGPFDRRG